MLEGRQQLAAGRWVGLLALGKVTAVGVVACAALHLVQVAFDGAHQVGLHIGMLMMALVCLACARELWTKPMILGSWILVIGMYGFMASWHLVLLASQGWSMSADSAHHGHGPETSWIMSLNTAVVLVVLTLAVAGAILTNRLKSRAASDV